MKTLETTACFSWIASLRRSAGLNMAGAIGLFVATILLTGCVTRVGRPIDSAKVPQIVDGKTSQTEIESWFGKPKTISQFAPKPNGAVVQWIWSYAQTNPGISLFYPSADGEALVVEFNQHGTVVYHDYEKHHSPGF